MSIETGEKAVPPVAKRRPQGQAATRKATSRMRIAKRRTALDATPRGIDPGKVRDWLATRPGVSEVHDLHIWAMSTTENALTAHVVRPLDADHDQFLHDACSELASKFNIGHATIQVESSHGAHACRLAPADVV